MGNDTMARSWFCVANNPQEHGYIGTPEEIAERIADDWVKDNPQRSCAIAYCISADGLHHLHKVLEDVKNMRSKVYKKSPLLIFLKVFFGGGKKRWSL